MQQFETEEEAHLWRDVLLNFIRAGDEKYIDGITGKADEAVKSYRARMERLRTLRALPTP